MVFHQPAKVRAFDQTHQAACIWFPQLLHSSPLYSSPLYIINRLVVCPAKTPEGSASALFRARPHARHQSNEDNGLRDKTAYISACWQMIREMKEGGLQQMTGRAEQMRDRWIATDDQVQSSKQGY